MKKLKMFINSSKYSISTYLFETFKNRNPLIFGVETFKNFKKYS